MYNIYNTISDMDIPNGHTKRMDCPNCGGKKTFTVTNNMGSLVWNCYKVSCGIKGGTRVHLSVDDIRTGFAGAEEYAQQTFSMPDYVVQHRGNKDIATFCTKWGIDADELNLMHDVKENRVVFPVLHDSVIVDATGRSLGNRLPKWKRYGKSGLPYSIGSGNTAIVVEDCVSAAVVASCGLRGVALLGTTLTDSYKQYLSQFSTVFIALDPDALPKTLDMARELRGHVGNVQVLRLNDDIKYRHPEDINKLDDITRR